MFFRDLNRILLLTLFFGAVTVQGSSATTGDGVAIVMDRTSAESLKTLEELRTMNAQLLTLFRVTGWRQPRHCKIVLSEEVPKGELRTEFKPQEWTLHFNDRDGDWRSDYSLRRKLFGLLLLAKVPNSIPPPSSDFLPGWIAAGLEARLRNARESETLLRRNRWLPVLRALAEQDTFPDFHRMRMIDPQLLPSPARVWYEELSRVMLELGSERSGVIDNALLDYCILSTIPAGSENQNFLSTLGRVLLEGAAKERIFDSIGREQWDEMTEAEKLQRILERQARRMAFNEYFPQPVHLIVAAFESLDPVSFPVLNEKGEPTGEQLRFPLAEFPEHILGRLDAQQQQIALRNRILALREGNSISGRLLLENLAEALMLLPLQAQVRSTNNPAPAIDRFRQEIARIRADLERRAKIEDLLERTEQENRIPAEFYDKAIREAEQPAFFFTDREKDFLDRVEREWLDD